MSSEEKNCAVEKRFGFFFVKVFYGLGFYGGIGPHVNDSYDNAGYGQGGISWLTHTSLNRTNLFDNDIAPNPNFGIKKSIDEKKNLQNLMNFLVFRK